MREGGAVGAILTDIEGTTSSIAFVTETLFPYARARIADYVAAHPAEAAAVPGDPVETLTRWIDEDRKETVLKQIQGRIWAEGYAAGELKGHVYPEAAAALRRWRERGIRLFVYSSGSVEAQRLIFGHSDQGDLTGLFEGYFDTTTGPKTDRHSYEAIAHAIGLPADEILFLSDNPAEVDAARGAGMQALLVDRSGGHGDVHSFDEVRP